MGAEENGLLLLAKNLEVADVRGRLTAPRLTLLSPLVLCNPDCTLWYLEIPVFQTKTFVWVTILSPKM